MESVMDFIIIGGGVVGSAIARELSRYKAKILLLEKAADVCFGTSARNSGVLHAGFNNKPGTMMARLCVEGNKTFDKAAMELDVRYKRTGKLVVGYNDDDLKSLEKLKENGIKNGIEGIDVVDRDFIKSKAPLVEGNFALWSPTTAVLSPFEYVIALAENAATNGVKYLFNHKVVAIEREDGLYRVKTENGSSFLTRWVINSAGIYSDKISDMLGIKGYEISPCRGEYFILDKNLNHMLPLPVYPVPNIKEGGLGIHLTTSVDGNIFIGPSNEYINEHENYASTVDVMKMLEENGRKILPQINKSMFIRSFAGIRPKLTRKDQGGYHDFVIERRDDVAPNAVNLVGIESPGLTSALPIANEVIRLVREKENLEPNPMFNPIHKFVTSFRDKSIEEKARLIKENPDYGEIICRCETITKAELLAAINNPLGVDTIAGIKYRCRAMMGRCQGGYCQTRITDLIISEKGKKCEDIRYSGENSYIFTGTLRKGN